MGGERHAQVDGDEQLGLTFAQLLESMFAQRFTGATTLHWKDGRPYLVDIPREPRRIRIAGAA